VRLGAGKARALLATLLLNANRVMSAERLIVELWGERPPRTARAALQGYVSQLRDALGEGSEATLVTEPGGYRLRVARGELDLDLFEALVAQAREAGPSGDHVFASERLREAAHDARSASSSAVSGAC
jgi:DNA-binding SARP family transcriptional activator